MAQIDDLNAAVASLRIAADNIIAAVSAGAPDLAPAITAINQVTADLTAAIATPTPV